MGGRPGRSWFCWEGRGHSLLMLVSAVVPYQTEGVGYTVHMRIHFPIVCNHALELPAERRVECGHDDCVWCAERDMTLAIAGAKL